jgi:hypothetical protein
VPTEVLEDFSVAELTEVPMEELAALLVEMPAATTDPVSKARSMESSVASLAAMEALLEATLVAVLV